MYKLLYTSNIPFDMRDWTRERIKNVYAGLNCIMAVTENGETLQKIQNTEVMARTRYWTRIKQIGISNWAEGVAIGLVEDGTCLIAKRAVRRMCEECRLNFEHINNEIKSWSDVIQVAASDAFFALRVDGTVRYVSVSCRFQAEYEAVKSWRDIIKIVTGVQNSVFGITKDGRVMAAGYNAQNIQKKLSKYDDVVDLYPLGSESTACCVLRRDGSIEYLGGYCSDSGVDLKITKLGGHFNYEVFALTEDQRIVDLSGSIAQSVFPENYKVVSYEVGNSEYIESFIVAVAEVKNVFE